MCLQSPTQWVLSLLKESIYLCTRTISTLKSITRSTSRWFSLRKKTEMATCLTTPQLRSTPRQPVRTASSFQPASAITSHRQSEMIGKIRLKRLRRPSMMKSSSLSKDSRRIKIQSNKSSTLSHFNCNFRLSRMISKGRQFCPKSTRQFLNALWVSSNLR